MSLPTSYRNALYAALALHFCLFAVLFIKPSTPRPVLVNETHNTPGEITVEEKAAVLEKEIVRAQGIDSKQVAETVNRLREEKLREARAEQRRQQDLQRRADQARQERIQEQQRLARLKKEAQEQALARKKQLEEEQQRFQEIARQKEKEAQRLQALRKAQQELKKKQEEQARLAELKRQQEAKAQAEKEALEKAELARKNALAEKQAADAAAKRARIAGEVDKYKALIVNAISRQWILPDEVEQGASSQFRIRLAPDGAVLDVSLTRSSGDPILDRSAQSAIFKASPLPVPTDPSAFDAFRDIRLTVRPENVRG